MCLPLETPEFSPMPQAWKAAHTLLWSPLPFLGVLPRAFTLTICSWYTSLGSLEILAPSVSPAFHAVLTGGVGFFFSALATPALMLFTPLAEIFFTAFAFCFAIVFTPGCVICAFALDPPMSLLSGDGNLSSIK